MIEEDKPTVIEQPRGQRQQPKRKDRQKTRPVAATQDVTAASAGADSSTAASDVAAPEVTTKPAGTQRQQPQSKKRKKR